MKIIDDACGHNRSRPDGNQDRESDAKRVQLHAVPALTNASRCTEQHMRRLGDSHKLETWHVGLTGKHRQMILCMHTILTEARRCMPDLLANVLLALSGSLLLLWRGTDPTMGIALALSVLSRAESVLLLAEADAA